MKQKQRWIAAALSILLSTAGLPLSAFAEETRSNEEVVYDFLTGTLQLNAATASGILANLYQESRFDPTASCIDTNHKISYGICQWNGTRYTALQSFCEANGYAYDTLDGQLAFLAYDLETTYSPYYYNTLLCDFADSPEGAYDAAYSWASIYEVCNSAYWESRGLLAQDIFYPAYVDYIPSEVEDVPVVVQSSEPSEPLPEVADLGTSFYATMQLEWLDEDEEETQDDSWRFMQQEDGSYLIRQTNGLAYLDGTSGMLSLSEQGSSWFLYETESGYLLQDVESGWLLMDTLQLEDIDWQVAPTFQINKLGTPKTVPLTIEAGTAGTVLTDTTFQWELAEDTTSYSVLIWKDTNITKTPVQILNGLQTDTLQLSLSAGIYTVILQQFNAVGSTKGTPMTFVVTAPREEVEVVEENTEVETSEATSTAIEETEVKIETTPLTELVLQNKKKMGY